MGLPWSVVFMLLKLVTVFRYVILSANTLSMLAIFAVFASTVIHAYVQFALISPFCNKFISGCANVRKLLTEY